ncbi:unnamed protein product [Chrysoparadoxa australica]
MKATGQCADMAAEKGLSVNQWLVQGFLSGRKARFGVEKHVSSAVVEKARRAGVEVAEFLTKYHEERGTLGKRQGLS